MNVINVVKPLQAPVTSKDLKEQILREILECNQCGKSLQSTATSKCIREHILEKNIMNVINVTKPLQRSVISKHIKST